MSHQNRLDEKEAIALLTEHSTSTTFVSNNIPFTFTFDRTDQPSGSPSGPTSTAEPSLYANLRNGEGNGAIDCGINANGVVNLNKPNINLKKRVRP